MLSFLIQKRLANTLECLKAHKIVNIFFIAINDDLCHNAITPCFVIIIILCKATNLRFYDGNKSSIDNTLHDRKATPLFEIFHN